MRCPYTAIKMAKIIFFEVQHHPAPVRTKTKALLCLAVRGVGWRGHAGKYLAVPYTLANTHLLHDQEITLLHFPWRDKKHIHSKPCMWMFVVSLFKTAPQTGQDRKVRQQVRGEEQTMAHPHSGARLTSGTDCSQSQPLRWIPKALRSVKEAQPKDHALGDTIWHSRKDQTTVGCQGLGGGETTTEHREGEFRKKRGCSVSRLCMWSHKRQRVLTLTELHHKIKCTVRAFKTKQKDRS